METNSQKRVVLGPPIKLASGMLIIFGLILLLLMPHYSNASGKIAENKLYTKFIKFTTYNVIRVRFYT